MQDLRLAIRALRGTPVVSVVAVLSLALGIGANTAIFSLVNSVLMRALPVVAPQRLVVVTTATAASRGTQRWWNYPVWDEIRRRPALFDGAVAWVPNRFNLASGGPAEFVDGLWASGSFFSTLGVRAISGRVFTETDDARDGGPTGVVAVVSSDFATRRFGDASAAIGRILTLDRVAFTIVGVTPPEFFGLESAIDSMSSCRSAQSLWCAGRKPPRPARRRLGDDHGAPETGTNSRGGDRPVEGGTAGDLGSNDPEECAARIPRAISGRVIRARSGCDGAVSAARSIQAAAARDHGRRCAGPADCLRERREPAARARVGEASRAERAAGSRRIAVAHRAPTAR